MAAYLDNFNTAQLWNLPPDQFNIWRRKNDYPRLFELFERKLPFFNEWMEKQKITQELMFELGLARFISSEELISACRYEDGKLRLFLSNFEKLPSIKKAGWIVEINDYQPYLYWLRKRVSKSELRSINNSLMITGRSQGRTEFLREHFLLELGNTSLMSPVLSGRLLDFTCIDNLKIFGAISNEHVYLWHSSAIGVEINGGFAFLDAYRTAFWDHGYGTIKRQLVLIDGVFQDFHFKDCELRLHAVRSSITRSSFRGVNFDATLEHTSISDTSFNAGPINGKNFVGREKYYAKVTALCASIGNNNEAGNYFFEQKFNEMISMLFPWIIHRDRWYLFKPQKKLWTTTKCWCGLFPKLINYLAWGFGERPFRSLATSIAIIVACTVTFYLSTASSTNKDVASSLYFSVVTFTTLGYGDILQTDMWLRLLSAAEALCGMVLMGLFLGGFASKSKQY